MAITRIHAIKATVSGAVNYICNEKKTDSSLLISSFGTTPETAANDFKFTLSHTDSSDPNKAFHLIQSFAPGEVSAEEAHKVGEELADRLLKGRYSYIVATHTDKGHIHNHILFCAADNIDYKKYHDCKRTYWDIRHLNDELCEAQNLSVIRENKYKAKKYKEWLSDKSGTSWKSQLKSDINETIKLAHSYEEFLSLMQAKGYQIKDSEISPEAHKYIGFLAHGQVKWIRGREKSLGPEYTKERIKERIEEKARIRAERMKKLTTRPQSLIDTSQERFSESPGLMRWAEKENLKRAAQIQSKLAEMGFKSLEEVDERIEALHQQAKTGKKATIALDKDIKSAAEILRYARQYSEKKKYDRNYKKSKDPERYYQTHNYDLHLAWGARDILESAGINPETINLQDIESRYEKLCADRMATSDAYKKAERECEKLKQSRDALLTFIGQEPSQDIDRDKKIIR
ncbi:MAG: relaxase/mobilization nuclease domain-containing protein [Lachnospiraceae bacterium]|nr:relaxase/mobilization nuclease domain-containing protein [Lachnospiraceae bacterium]